MKQINYCKPSGIMTDAFTNLVNILSENASKSSNK